MSKKRAAKKKNVLNKKDAGKLESKVIEPQQASKEKPLEFVVLKEPYIEKVEQIKEHLNTLIAFRSIKLGDKDVIKLINEAIKSLGGSLNVTPIQPRDDYDFGLKYFANALFGTKDHNVFFNKAINSFQKAKQNKDLAGYQAIIDEFLMAIEQCYISSDILEQNADSVKSNLSTLSHETLATIYSNNCKFLMKDLHLDYAKAAGKIAYDLLDYDQTISDHIKLQVVYNMALCTSKYDPLKSIEYYDEAEKIAPNDHDVIHDKCIIYTQNSLFDRALIEAKKFPHYKAVLYTIYIALQADPNLCKKVVHIFNRLELSESIMKDFVYLSIKANIDAYQVSFNKSIEVHKELVLSAVGSFEERCEYFKSALSNYIRSSDTFGKKQVKSLMQFHEMIYREAPEFNGHKSFGLTCCEFMLFFKCHKMEEAKIKLDALNELVKGNLNIIQNKSYAQKIGEMYVAHLIEAKDFISALDFIKNESIADESDKQKNITLINKLIEAEKLPAESLVKEQPVTVGAEAKQLVEEQSEEEPAEQSTAFCLIDWAASPEELASYSDPRVINAYFQNKKEQLSKIQFNDNRVETQEASWDIGNKIAYKSVFEIQQKPHFHASISDKILASLDLNAQQQFLGAIKSGLVVRKQGQNGIKFIGNQIVELKINADLRLYTKKIYKNSDGEYLIVFDNSGSHSAIAKAMKGSIEIIATETMKSNVSFVTKLFEEEKTPIYDASSFESKDAELAGDQELYDDSI